MFNLLNLIFGLAGKIFRYSPFYPYLIYFHFCWRDNKKISTFFKGEVLEVGAGSLQMRDYVLSTNKDVTSYTASDLFDQNTETHYEFENYKAKQTILTNLYSAIMGRTVDYTRYDLSLDCRDLGGIPDQSLDTYFASEVFEHVDNLDKALAEAHRVLRPGGRLIFTVPFLYQEHGPQIENGLNMDYWRHTRGGYYKILSDLKFDDITIFSCVSYPISMTQVLANQTISKFRSQSRFTQLFTLPLILTGFFLYNSLGLALHLLLGKNDQSLGRFNIVCRKI